MMIHVGYPTEFVPLGVSYEQWRDGEAPTGDEIITEAHRTVNDPEFEQVITVTREGTTSTAVLLSSGPLLTAMIVEQPDGTATLAAVTRESLPAVIARIVGLGPAPYEEEMDYSISQGDFEALLNASNQPEKKKIKRSVDLLFGNSEVRAWYNEFRMPVGDQIAVDRLDVVGAPGVGWWIAELGRFRVTLSRTRSAALWAMLSEHTPQVGERLLGEAQQ